MIGFGKYARPQYDMGIEDEVVIPQSIEPVAAAFQSAGTHVLEASVASPARGSLRIVTRQRTPDGYIRRTWAGGPPKGENMGRVFRIEASQNGKPLGVRINYDKVIRSGVGEVDGLAAGSSWRQVYRVRYR